MWAPRPSHEKWRADTYMELLALQRETCRRVGHRHVVVTDAELTGYDTLKAELSAPLMHALIDGQLAYLEQWNDQHPVVLLDIDCLVVRDLGKAFDGSFDIAVTRREHPTQPIQNGAIYLAPGSRHAIRKILGRTRALCEEWWGSDQVALAQALGPIPRTTRTEWRHQARVAFLPTELHNFSSKNGVPKTVPGRFVFHFKGDTKQYAADAARKNFLLPGAE